MGTLKDSRQEITLKDSKETGHKLKDTGQDS